jgi:glycosyltransferase involved in cell wall biosynthesis
MTPRILFVTHTAALGGAELYLRDIADQLHDHCAVVLFEDGPLAAELTQRGVAVHVLRAPSGLQSVRKSSGLGASLRALPGLLRLVRSLSRLAADYDLLYANSQKALIVGALAAWHAGRPLVWNLHDLLTADHFSPFARRLATTVANLRAQRVVCNSAATERAFRASGGRTPTTTVYNGFDPAPFESVTDDDVTDLRTTLGLGTATTIGVFSRLAAWKGQHVLLEALPTLPDVHVLLVGDALFGEDDAYAARLRRQVAQTGLGDRVHFLGFRQDIPRLMKAVDVVAHTSVAAEPFGRVIVEGMLAGRPVVATRAGGAVEIIRDGVNGRLVPPGDPHALATTLQGLLRHPIQTATMARRGAEHARSHFLIAEAARRVDALSVQAAGWPTKSPVSPMSR